MGSAALKLKKTVSKVKVIIPQVCAHCLMGLGWACGVGVIVERGKLEISRTYFGNAPLPAALTRSAWLFGWQRMARRNWSRESLGCWLTPPYTELSSAPSVSPTCTQVQRAEEHSVHSHRAELETGWIWELTWGSPPHAHQPLGSHFPSFRGFSRVWWLLLIDWLIDWLIDFKKLTHRIVEAGKFRISWAGWQAREPGKSCYCNQSSYILWSRISSASKFSLLIRTVLLDEGPPPMTSC